MRKHLVHCLLVLIVTLPTVAQTAAPAKAATDLDPLALQVLKAVVDPIRNAKSFSFRILAARDWLGTNDQIITKFSASEFTVERPDKLHIKFRSQGEPVELFFDGTGQTELYSPSVKLYSTISTPKSIDGMLDEAAKKGIFIAVRNFLESDPYKSLTDGLMTAYVVGRTTIFDQEVHHLAFTEPGAEWQLWVVGGDKPSIRRLEVINKDKPHNPRIVVDFLDWDLNASPTDDMFVFHKPEDAHEIEMLKLTAEGKK